MSRSDRSWAAFLTPGRERGAAAVEMAIVLPLLFLVLGGAIDLGRLFYAEIIVTNAAREGVRLSALGYTDGQVSERVVAATPNIDAIGGLAAPVVNSCPTPLTRISTASVTVSTESFDWLLLGAFGSFDAPQASSTATMRCGG